MSWLFEGEIEHRDSDGHHAIVRPGEVNLMTAGRGISHSEVSTTATTRLHGAQLWVALPEDARSTDPGFAHHAPTPVTGEGWEARVFLGSLLGYVSPVATATPLLGAEVVLDAGAGARARRRPGVRARRPRRPGAGRGRRVSVGVGDLAYVPVERTTMLTLAPATPARVLLLGGPPFGESIVMWWNFVGRSHEEIARFRDDWQAQIDGDRLLDGHFGVPVDDALPPIPAPPLPGVRLRERR